MKGVAEDAPVLEEGNLVRVCPGNWGLVFMSGRGGSSGASAQTPLGALSAVMSCELKPQLCKGSEILFLLRTGKASCPRAYSGLKPLVQPQG